jgi:hypothetical protein
MTWEPPDFSKPSVARVHDALLGGHDTFAPDRELDGRLLEICPGLSSAVRENRSFIACAADWAAWQGIRQFADLGTGLPAHPSAAAVRADTPPRSAPIPPLYGWSTSTTTPWSPPTCGRCW